jgi:hypothetical protein
MTLNNPLQSFGDRRHTISYESINKTNEGKTRKSEKNGTPLYPGILECVGKIPAKLGRDEKIT